MTTKQWLQQARTLPQRIAGKIEQLDEWNALARKTTTAMSGMPGGAGNGRTMENMVVKIIGLQESIAEDINELTKLQQDIQTAISALEDPVQVLILQERYINGHTLEEIADATHYDVRTIVTKHGQALQSIKR